MGNAQGGSPFCWFLPSVLKSGKKQEPKPKLFGLDIFGWGGGLPREGVGAKKFGMSFETQGTKLFGGIYPRIFARDILEVPKKLRKNVCVQFFVPYKTQHS